MKKFDYYEVLIGLDGLDDWSYTESEGADCTRFDKGESSLWIYKSGSVSIANDGNMNINKIKEYLKTNGVIIK